MARLKYDPRELAINFIKPYVIRGDSVKSLISGQGGESCRDYSIEIGGYIWSKDGTKLLYRAKRDEVVASGIDDKDSFYVFKLRKLYDEINSQQLRLL